MTILIDLIMLFAVVEILGIWAFIGYAIWQSYQ